ncbi:TonB-dependent receptor [Duganella radicis]|uniref:TonB-dependent receptor plug domain-containing protein n=1 Tax=Duganella radicis TaxID=551988 RepID=A0A6L6PCA3_9BURK|nr:TonB-dependent receptor plug domain-containing protein [Duganella radicis]MTV36289.1 TonB-dependent receptor plug domain-containing protein [Duganella radicis]
MKSNDAAIKLTLCATALALAFPVMAQQASSQDDGKIPEVIVTANKRKESIQSVAMSVDAVSGDMLQKMNIQQFQDVEKLVPGLVLDPGDGRGQTVTLRGISFNPDTGTSPSVQIYWNETPISASNAFRAMFDIGRIEVLHGPQGTLRGQTSPAGSITIATQRPDTSAVSGRVSQTFGSDHMRNSQAAVNVPLIPNELALRVAGMYNYSENGVHNIVNGATDSDRGKGGRISVLYQPNKSLEVLLVHQVLTSNVVNDPMNIGQPFDGQPGPVLGYGDRAAVVDGPYRFYNHTKLTSLNVGWEFAGHKLSYIGGFQRSAETDDRDTDVSNIIPGWSNQQFVKFSTQQRTHELRFESTGARRWNYMVGAYYSHTDGPAEFTQKFPYYYPTPFTPPLEVTLKGTTADGSYGKGTALFTDHTLALTDADQLELGVRLQKNKGYSQQYLEVFGQKQQGLPDDRAHTDTKAWTGSASYRHNFNKNVMAYVSAGTGYREGGTTAFVTTPGLSPDLITYRPEKSRSIELGVKSTLLERRLVLNADIFQQNLKNFIGRMNELSVRAAAKPGEPAGPGAGGSYPGDASGTINLNTNGDLISRGIEANAVLRILPNWRAQASFSYVDSHYDNAELYCNDSNNDGVPDRLGNSVQPGRQVSVCRSNGALTDEFGTQNGKFNMTLQSEYTHDIGNLEAFARGLVRYTPARYNQPNDQHIASFTPVDLFFGVRNQNQDWDVTFWVQNVFNRSPKPFHAPGVASNGLVGGYNLTGIPPERKLGMTVRYDF